MKGASNKSGEGLKGEAKTAHIKKAQGNDKALIKYVKDFKESIKDKSKITLTRKQQYYLFFAIYDYYDDKAEYLSTKPDVCKKYLNDNKIDWDALPQKVKDVLVDLTYRGDYTGSKDKRGNTRKVIVPAVYRDQIEENYGLKSKFRSTLENEKLWLETFEVDDNRFNNRVQYLDEIK